MAHPFQSDGGKLMAQRWVEDEDRFIIAFFDTIGVFIGPHDLGRSEAATTARARHLKKTGAWEAYLDADRALYYARKLAGHL